MRAFYMVDIEKEAEFAREAAAWFAKNPQGHSYTSGEIVPGCFLALRWGLDGNSVVVLKLDEIHTPGNYMELTREYQEWP